MSESNVEAHYERVRAGRTVSLHSMEPASELLARLINEGLATTLTFSPSVDGKPMQVNIRLGINV